MHPPLNLEGQLIYAYDVIVYWIMMQAAAAAAATQRD